MCIFWYREFFKMYDSKKNIVQGFPRLVIHMIVFIKFVHIIKYLSLKKIIDV